MYNTYITFARNGQNFLKNLFFKALREVRYVFALDRFGKSVRGTDCPEDRARSPHREIYDRSRFCSMLKSKLILFLHQTTTELDVRV